MPGGPLLARAPLELRQRQIGHDARATGRAVDHHLVHVAQHLFHGLEVEAPGGHVRRLGILVVDREETLRVALGVSHHLLAVGLGFLHQPLGFAAGTWQNVVGEGLRLVLRPLAVGLGPLHVAERIDHLTRRIDLLQLHLVDQDAGAILVEGRLHLLARLHLDVAAAFGRRLGERRLADDLAHHALGDRLHRLLGIANVEQELARVLDLPEQHEVDVDDVLVAGQDQALVGHVSIGAAAPRLPRPSESRPRPG